MQTVIIYYLILVLVSNHISNYQYQALIKKQHKTTIVTNSRESDDLSDNILRSSESKLGDIWAMELHQEESIPKMEEEIEYRLVRQQEPIVEQQGEKGADIQQEEKTVDRAEMTDEKKTVDKEETIDKAEMIDKEGLADKEETVDKEERIDKAEMVDKEELADKKETVGKEETIDRVEQSYNEANGELIKDSKEIPVQDKTENSKVEKGENPKEENTKSDCIGKISSEQTTSSSYNLETKDSMNENQIKDSQQSEKEFNDYIHGNLEQNQVIRGDVHIEEEGLDLNGQTLEIWGNLYHHQGTLSINNGKLVVHGSYFVNQEVKKSGNNSLLVLNNENDLIIVEGDIISYGTDWFKKCIKGKIILEGDFKGGPTTSEICYHMPLRSQCELILAGENAQTVDISSMWVKLPTIRIAGKNNREIKLMMLKDQTIQSRKHHLNNLETEIACQIELPESLVIENINAKAPLMINGDCEAKQLNIFGNEITINGNLKIQDGISFMKGQVIVNGLLSLVTAHCIEMKYSEDKLKIKDDLIMLNCKELTLNEGELYIGGNIIQRNALGEFITKDKMNVVFFNHQNGQERVQGNLIILNRVKYSRLTLEETL